MGHAGSTRTRRLENAPPKLNEAALARTDRPSDVANSTAALIGLGGLFLLLAGTAAIGWTRFRRYDDQRLDEILNPEGKLPTHLDPKAKDMEDEARGQASAHEPTAGRLGSQRRKRRRRDRQEAAAGRPRPPVRRGEGQHERRGAGGAQEEADGRSAGPPGPAQAALPTFDPTDPAAAALPRQRPRQPAAKSRPDGGTRRAEASLQKARRWLRRKAPDCAGGRPAGRGRHERPPRPSSRRTRSRPPRRTEQPAAEHGPPSRPTANGSRPPQAVPPIPAPHVNG